MSDFIQSGPDLGRPYEDDRLLQSYLAWRLPRQFADSVDSDLKKFSARLQNEVAAFGEQAESAPPELVSYSAWGERIDEIKISQGWQKLHEVSAEEGLVAIGYERKQAEYSRLYQFAKLYLFHPYSAFYSCPLAMTDGAARALELYAPAEIKQTAFRHLTSRDAKSFWTSGQWMTEKTGGSDVSGTSTIARADGVGNRYRLFGDKWFTSATTSQMSLALGRIEGDVDGSRGLSLFYIQLRDDRGKSNKIKLHRLKDKLGTKALPTAELSLEGTIAEMIGERGQGVRTVAAMLNITRLYNSVCALGAMRRALILAKSYARKRQAFGHPLARQPLHVETLAQLEVQFAGCFHLTFRLAELLGKEELSQINPQETSLLRLLTPVVKLWTAKQSLAITSEALESFGGAGYIEDTGLPRLLRDAQVFSIWEGTTNVLSLDVLRVLNKDPGVLKALNQDISERLVLIHASDLHASVASVQAGLKLLNDLALQMLKGDSDFQQTNARRFAFLLAKIYAGSLLLEFAENVKGLAGAVEVARRWCAQTWLDASIGESSGDAEFRRLSEEIIA
jgi:putative acyl-CoA dehydrogenase